MNKRKVKAFVSVAMAVIMCIMLFPAFTIPANAEGNVTEIFSDVKEGAWYVKAVQYVYDNAIMGGTGATFGVSSPLKREQFAATLYNMAGRPEIPAEAEINFSDVANTPGYPRDGILWAVSAKVAAGNADGTFGVGQSIQRQAVASMLYRYADACGYDLTLNENALDGFSDAASVQPWATNAMKWAVTKGIISGKGNNLLDPAGKATRAECAMMIMKLKTNVAPQLPKVGDIVTFGKYEQDGNTDNGAEDIEWQVLKVEGNRALVISKYALDCQPYHNVDEKVTWETCSLRQWMNNDFLNAAFTEAEQKSIPQVTLKTNDNRYYNNCPGGNDTVDRVFCLSMDEVETLFGDFNAYYEYYLWGYKKALICSPTPYARSRGAHNEYFEESMLDWECSPASCPPEDKKTFREIGYTEDLVGCQMTGWWLRSGTIKGRSTIDPSTHELIYCQACHVLTNGGVGDLYMGYYSDHISVRPAIYINY